MTNSSLEKQVQRLLAAIESIERFLQSDPKRIEHDLTKPQLLTLVHVARKKCCTMTELSKLTGYATSACTGIVDRMIKKKLVRRERDEKDRRVVNVLVTDRGTEAASAFYRKVLKNAQSALEKVDEKEREKFVFLFEKIAAEFRKG